jgi:hypothetical protein
VAVPEAVAVPGPAADLAAVVPAAVAVPETVAVQVPAADLAAVVPRMAPARAVALAVEVAPTGAVPTGAVPTVAVALAVEVPTVAVALAVAVAQGMAPERAAGDLTVAAVLIVAGDLMVAAVLRVVAVLRVAAVRVVTVLRVVLVARAVARAPMVADVLAVGVGQMVVARWRRHSAAPGWSALTATATPVSPIVAAAAPNIGAAS